MKMEITLRGWRHALLFALLVLLLGALPSAGSRAGQQRGGFNVSVQVVRPHVPTLAQAIPLPAPGHLMWEDAGGRHYYYDGTLQDARAYYLAQMQRLGHTLRSEHPGGALMHDMHWERHDEITLVQLRSAAGMAPTRISLRVMKEASHAPG